MGRGGSGTGGPIGEIEDACQAVPLIGTGRFLSLMRWR